MKAIFLSFFIFSFSASALENGWTDKNGVEWFKVEPRKSYVRALQACADATLVLPDRDIFAEALDLGLSDPKINTVSGSWIAEKNWFWLPGGRVISLKEEIKDAKDTDRHWVLCVRDKGMRLLEGKWTSEGSNVEFNNGGGKVVNKSNAWVIKYTWTSFGALKLYYYYPSGDFYTSNNLDVTFPSEDQLVLTSSGGKTTLTRAK